MSTEPYQPSIPAGVRTVVYIVGLVVGFCSILAIGLGAIAWPDQSTQITAAAGVVGTAVGWLASALGVVYRPTAAAAPTPEHAVLDAYAASEATLRMIDAQRDA